MEPAPAFANSSECDLCTSGTILAVNVCPLPGPPMLLVDRVVNQQEAVQLSEEGGEGVG